MESDMDNSDLACAARLGRFLECLIDHRAVRIGIRHAEHRHRLVVLSKLIDQILDGAGGVPLRRCRRTIVALKPSVFLECFVEALLICCSTTVAVYTALP
jgi:hypothetical protein